MDPKLQSSFIPKKPIPNGPALRSVSTVNIFFVIALFIFILSLAAGAFIFFYNQHQEQSISSKASQLETIKRDFSDKLTQELTRLDSRLITANKILDQHLAISSAFKLIQAITAKNVQFTKFEYTLKNGTTPNLVLAGQGRSFNTVSFQSDLFRNNPSIKAPLFSDIRLDEKGNVLFSVTADLDPELVLYKTLFK